MDRLNYQHLFYFWNVAREGSVTRACEKLRLAQPTISGQLAVFEESIGEKLFRRDGRKLTLTETGRAVFQYAEEIFTLGRELTNTLKGRPGQRGMRLGIGAANVIQKLIVFRLIEPALRLSETPRLFCYEDKTERLLAEISLHGIDLALLDTPATPTIGARTFNHLLGECGVAVFGASSLAGHYRRRFPRSLDGAPFLLPTADTALRRALDQWFDAEGLRPDIKAEIEDSALMKTFGSSGLGLFVAPAPVKTEIEKQYDVKFVGMIDAVRERFYAVTSDRKIKHPAVTAILESARDWLF
ncbi:MAG: transcriptional activator NhaR [Alphaproteobacteria bacterium]|nr:transcriptional activator NhaR [Alphaproteobacteria bacterium]